MKTPMLLALLLSTGCGIAGVDPDDDSMSNDCAVEGLFAVHSEKKISCRKLSVNVGLARDMMIARGWVADEAEFNKLYSMVEIHILDRRCLTGPSIGLIPLPGCLYGQYYENHENPALYNPNVVTGLPLAYIELDWDAGALAHELMHHYDYTHGREAVSASHDHWGQLGYLRYASDYALSRLALN